MGQARGEVKAGFYFFGVTTPIMYPLPWHFEQESFPPLPWQSRHHACFATNLCDFVDGQYFVGWCRGISSRSPTTVCAVFQT
jgi:hypothetical protein